MHPRRQIREGVAARLGAIVNPLAPVQNQVYWSPAQGRVYSTRSTELTPADLPLIIVQSNDETVLPINKSGFDGGYRRTLTLTIEGLAEALDDVEDNLDALAIGIEGGMDGLVIPNAESGRLILLQTEMDIDREGEIPIGAVRLTYECVYTSYHLGVDLGLWDRDGKCVVQNGPSPSISQITIRSNFGDETYEVNP